MSEHLYRGRVGPHICSVVSGRDHLALLAPGAESSGQGSDHTHRSQHIPRCDRRLTPPLASNSADRQCIVEVRGQLHAGAETWRSNPPASPLTSYVRLGVTGATDQPRRQHARRDYSHR